MNENHIVTGRVRLSYVTLLAPKANKNNASGDKKFSVTVLLPKADVTTKQKIDAAIEAAKQDGSTRLWGGRPPIIPVPIHDGDGVRESDGMPFGDECKGCWVFTASCKADRPPRVVDLQLQDVMDAREIYSGMYGRVGIDFYPYYQANKKGVGCGLTNVQKLADGEPLSGGTTAEEDFGSPQPQQPQYAPQQYAPRPQPQGAWAPNGQVNPSSGEAMGYNRPAPQSQQYAPQTNYDPLTGLPQ